MDEVEKFRCGHPRSPENVKRNGNPRGACGICARASDTRQRLADPAAYNAAQKKRQQNRRLRAGLPIGHVKKTECPQGHPYDEVNTYVSPDGYPQCKVCRKVRVREDRIKHTEKRKADQAIWRDNNREWIAKHSKAWRLANPERSALHGRLKKQRRRAAGIFTLQEWQQVLATYGENCLACGSDDPPTIDHVVPISKGGSNTIENIQPLCQSCNSRKHTKVIDYRPGAAVV